MTHTVKQALFVSISERVWIFKEQDPPRNTKAVFLTFALFVVLLLMGIPIPHTLVNSSTFYNPDTGKKCIGIRLASNRMLGAALKSIRKGQPVFQWITPLLAAPSIKKWKEEYEDHRKKQR